ncbi:hypothetical protein [Roseococcus thiosulfatophilus]|uniref:hypothetical protein n=1 Tax=Roseococcus thiosulfatophilus TaxID=35813 RepID=UPI001A90331A|nr:hypothetical protein [Roseococcus thiosulfatophilus]
MPAGAAANRDELERLVAALERSGLAESRADIAALLAQSKAMLGTPARPSGRPRRRARVSARGKLRALVLLLLDALAAMATLYGAAGLGFGTVEALEGGLALAAGLGWGLWRWGGLPALLAEALFRLRYALRWAGLWLAEPFSDRAYEALETLLDAREVMRGWRAHRRTLPHAPGLAEVETWLRATYGPRIAARFARAAEGRRAGQPGWTLRGGQGSGPPRPVPASRMMRWPSLITLFEATAAGGALWATDPPPEPPPVAPPALPPIAPPAEAEPPEHLQRRLDLRDLIRKKRQDITTAYGWKLKTEAEIAQRDNYLNELRAEIAALEKELAALGGPPA